MVLDMGRLSEYCAKCDQDHEINESLTTPPGFGQWYSQCEETVFADTEGDLRDKIRGEIPRMGPSYGARRVRDGGLVTADTEEKLRTRIRSQKDE